MSFEDHAVDEPPEEGAVRDRADEVKAGVLLDEHGGDADQNAHGDGDQVQLPLAQRRRIDRGGDERGRADDVHTREHVRVRVGGVNTPDEPGGNILMLEHRRAQLLPVGEHPVEQDDRDKAERDKQHIGLKILRVPEREIERHGKQQRMPQAVGEDEPLAEGDGIVQRAVHHIIIALHGVLHDRKKHQIDHPEHQHPQMPVIGHRADPQRGLCSFSHEPHTPP